MTESSRVRLSFPNSCSGTPSAKLPFRAPVQGPDAERVQFTRPRETEFRGMHSRTEFGNESARVAWEQGEYVFW